MRKYGRFFFIHETDGVGLANALPFSGLGAAKPAPRFYADASAATRSAATACWPALLRPLSHIATRPMWAEVLHFPIPCQPEGRARSAEPHMSHGYSIVPAVLEGSAVVSLIVGFSRHTILPTPQRA